MYFILVCVYFAMYMLALAAKPTHPDGMLYVIAVGIGFILMRTARILDVLDKQEERNGQREEE